MFVFLGYFGTNVCFCKNSCDYFLKRCATFNSNIWSHCVQGHTHTPSRSTSLSTSHIHTHTLKRREGIVWADSKRYAAFLCVGIMISKKYIQFCFGAPKVHLPTYIPRGFAKKVLKITCKWIVLGQSFFNFLSIKQSKLFDSWIIQIGE